jgi:hypothetical protein
MVDRSLVASDRWAGRVVGFGCYAGNTARSVPMSGWLQWQRRASTYAVSSRGVASKARRSRYALNLSPLVPSRAWPSAGLRSSPPVPTVDDHRSLVARDRSELGASGEDRGTLGVFNDTNGAPPCRKLLSSRSKGTDGSKTRMKP